MSKTIFGLVDKTRDDLVRRFQQRNPGLITLAMIEVQSGGYLGEDDIVRFEDSYGRK